MSGSTALGFPYMDDTDSMADIAQWTQDLTDFLNDNVGIAKAGVKSSGVLVAATVKTVSVAFATAFPVGVTPVVTLALTNVLGASNYFVDVRNITRNGFDIAIRRDTGTAAIDVQWIARSPQA